MERTISIILCVALMVLLPSNIGGQRPGSPYVKKKPVAPVAPVVPDTDSNVQGNTDPSGTSIQVKQATDDEAMRHIEDLENSVSILKLQNQQLHQTMNSLRMASINIQRTMGVMASKISELDKLANQNKELTRMLTYFETFFGVLYSEVPEAFDSTLPVETRMSKMNTYLGNQDATLAELRPKPPVVQLPEPEGVSEEITVALLKLSQDNSNLASKVTNLEANVQTTNQELAQAKAGSPNLGGIGYGGDVGGDCSCDDDDIYSRMNVIEDTLNIFVENAATVASSSPSSKSAGKPPSIPDLTEDDLNVWRSFHHTERAVSNTRKSVFSAIRHKPLIGDSARQVLNFDSVHVNKGTNFRNNTIFVCTVEGFYFFHFNVRSYDGHYMGVALVKNGEMMTSVYTDASERSIMQSQSMVLHMRPDDEVWLELGASDRFAIHSDIHKYTTFTGFLIYKGR